ncbi:MAG: hypothetical protein CL675_12205 [Bdellovibrionaceae bacterium]|nr:hypothetical protein [Pseudobdellovibrionaceae bacterium]
MEEFLSEININLMEREFITRGRAAQVEVNRCEIKQLEAFSSGGRFNEFYREFMRSLCIKIPDMREKHNSMAEIREEIEMYNELLAASESPYFQEQKQEWRDKQAVLVERYDSELNAYNAIISTNWRFYDTNMEEYIMSAIGNRSVEQEICFAGNPEVSETERQPIYDRFQEDVIQPMLDDARQSLASLGSSYRDISPRDMEMILARTPWDQFLDNGRTYEENKVLMCRIDRRFISGNQNTSNILTAVSFVGGASIAFLRGLRYAKWITSRRSLRLAGRTEVALFAMDLPVISTIVSDACTEPVFSYDLMQPTCPTGAGNRLNIQEMLTVERQKLRSMNCLLGSTTGYISPTLAYLLGVSN